MWTPGMGELIVILVIVLIIFGAGKLPSVGRSLGGAIKEFKDGVATEEEDEDSPTAEPDQKKPEEPEPAEATAEKKAD